jgi:hypothetical protein
MINVGSTVIGRIEATKNAQKRQRVGIVEEIILTDKNKKKFRVNWNDGSEGGWFFVNGLVAMAALPAANAIIPALNAPATQQVDSDLEDHHRMNSNEDPDSDSGEESIGDEPMMEE